MSAAESTAAPLPTTLRLYAADSVRLASTSPWNEPEHLEQLAQAVVVDAHARGWSAASLVSAFSLAWNAEQSWQALPHSWQIGVYERALAVLLERFIDASDDAERQQ